MKIRKGSVGQLVLKWQEFLIGKGYSIGSLDGVFGSKTETATIDWQTATGLTGDGIVGETSFAAARKQGFSHSPSSIWYPPRPNFSSPSLAKVQQMFGTFQYRRTTGSEIQILGNWVQQNIVDVSIPQLKGVHGAPNNGIVRFHKNGADQLKELFAEIDRQGLKHLVISWAGSFYPRMVRGSNKSLSNHSWGSAFDINAPENWLGRQPARVGQKGSLLQLVPIANAFGFFWGGHYNSRLDGMHFELAELDRYPN
jgi:hypothetical protein